MNRFLKTVILASCIAPSYLLAATQATTPAAKQAPAAAHTPNVSFVIVSQSALLQKGSNNHYNLTLYGVTPYIRYYTQRPSRATGLAQMQNFISSWGVGGNQSFQADNPNVVVYASKINGSDNIANHFTIGIMSNPQYNIARQQFSCDILPLNGEKFNFDKIDFENISLVIN